MKKFLGAIFFIVLFLVIGIPALVLFNFERPPEKDGQEGTLTVRVLNKATNKITQIPLEEYLVGVVAAEMPAKFEEEALKSQAVAARTYTVKRMFHYGAKADETHPEAEVCTDPTHCQAWADTDELKKKWGQINYWLYISKIKKAVWATAGEVITYNGQLIDPVYHGSCGGIGTENSEEVWASQVPYLRGVDCADEYNKESQIYTVTKSKSEVTAMLKPVLAASGVSLSDPIAQMKIIEKTGQGRIKEVEIGGSKMPGTDLRQKLGLSSTMFTWKVSGDKILFTVTGKGHAVGMCQYGANGMALKGKSYTEILKHYYTGIEIKKIK